MPDPREPAEIESQDLAETFDEENITPDGRDIATSDMQRDVYDVTSAPEDADEALAPDDAFDPDAMDEAEREEIVQVDEDLDAPRALAGDDADRVADYDAQPDDFEPGAGAPADYDAEDAMADRVDRDLGRSAPPDEAD